MKIGIPPIAACAAWIPLAALLFRVIGPMKATAFTVIGGLLLLPRGTPRFGLIPFDKRTAIGLGLALGLLLFGRSSIAKARPRWPDLLMIAFAVAPLTGLIAGLGLPDSIGDVVDQICYRTTGALLPYAAGRLYFGDRDGPRRVAVAIVLGGLSYIPVCLFEEAVGPGHFLAGVLYGTPPMEFMVHRLGGFRPEGLLDSGIELADWMAMTTVIAAWLWAGRAWPARPMVAWVPSSALLLTTLTCRGVYGYITLGLGLAALAATRVLRTRVFLVVLALAPPAYIAARSTGAWDGAILVELAERAGRGGTVSVRLGSEDEAIRKVFGRNPAFGLGVYSWHSDLAYRPDGQWAQVLFTEGLVGLIVFLGAFCLVPATLTLSRPRSRPRAGVVTSPAWGLTTLVLLQMESTLHNTLILAPVGLIAGSLIGRSLSGDPGVEPLTRPDPTSDRGRPRMPWPLALTVIALVILELVGRLPRTPPTVPTPGSIGDSQESSTSKTASGEN